MKVVVTDKAGKTTEKSTTITTNMLEEGDYVNYVDGTGVTRTCVVLYGPENANYSSYGIQIITMNSVENLRWGSATYNNAISTLNEKAEAYLNTTYASKARSVGSIPNNPDYESGMYTRDDTWFAERNGQYKDEDENYVADLTQMEALGIEIISNDSYWMASRIVYTRTSDSEFGVRLVLSSYGLTYSRTIWVKSESTTYSATPYFGLRPVFTLKSGIKVTGGSGTSSSPYTLGT